MSNWRSYCWKIYSEAEALKDKCRNCGTSKSLEFAHLEPTKLKGRGRGSHHRRLDVVKNKEKYTVLCRLCHWRFDHGNAEQRAAVITVPLSVLPFIGAKCLNY